MAKKNLIVYAFLTTLSLFLDIERLLVNIKNPYNNGVFEILLFFFLIYMLYKYYYEKKLKEYKILYLLSFVFSIFMIIGDSFNKVGSLKLLYANGFIVILTILRIIGYFILFKIVIHFLFTFIENLSLKDKTRDRKIKTLFLKHPFKFSLIFLLLAWLPYIIGFYPGILSPDPSNQIKQFFGIKTHYNESVVMLSNEVLITNHRDIVDSEKQFGALTFRYLKKWVFVSFEGTDS